MTGTRCVVQAPEGRRGGLVRWGVRTGGPVDEVPDPRRAPLRVRYRRVAEGLQRSVTPERNVRTSVEITGVRYLLTYPLGCRYVPRARRPDPGRNSTLRTGPPPATGSTPRVPPPTSTVSLGPILPRTGNCCLPHYCRPGVLPRTSGAVSLVSYPVRPFPRSPGRPRKAHIPRSSTGRGGRGTDSRYLCPPPPPTSRRPILDLSLRDPLSDRQLRGGRVRLKTVMVKTLEVSSFVTPGYSRDPPHGTDVGSARTYVFGTLNSGPVGILSHTPRRDPQDGTTPPQCYSCNVAPLQVRVLVKQSPLDSQKVVIPHPPVPVPTPALPPPYPHPTPTLPPRETLSGRGPKPLNGQGDEKSPHLDPPGVSVVVDHLAGTGRPRV